MGRLGDDVDLIDDTSANYRIINSELVAHLCNLFTCFFFDFDSIVILRHFPVLTDWINEYPPFITRSLYIV